MFIVTLYRAEKIVISKIKFILKDKKKFIDRWQC